MTERIDIVDLDVIYLSYDEPLKEEFWLKISNLVPWAKRVDRVKGIDAAHKKAAEISETDRFIIIDGDNLPDPDFFNNRLVIPDNLKDCVFRWKARNIINNLVYGNGGISCWTKEFVKNMRTHESTDGKLETQVEFCYDPKYIAMHDCYSTTYPNQSPWQAFRSGYREGVKLAMNRGVAWDKSNPKSFSEFIPPRNFKHLLIWQSIGADVENGIYAIFGAVTGTMMTLTEPYRINQINDYSADSLFDLELKILDQIISIKRRQLNLSLGIDIPEFNADQSKFFKFCMGNYKNKGIMEIDNGQ